MSTPAANLPQQNAEATPLRFVTAASLFDGHDAAINIMRRLIQAQGAEVVHLGHNRSVEDVVRAALQEDADGIALSSYQGGHVEYLKYMVDMLREHDAGHIRVFAGGGGTITPEEIRELEAYGVERIYHPNDGMKMGLVEMIEDVVTRAGEGRGKRGQSHFSVAGNDQSTSHDRKHDSDPFSPGMADEIAIGRVLSAIEDGDYADAELARLRKQWQLAGGKTPVIGITGTGGAGKSSVTDELLNRFLASFPKMHIA
ncbi:MAG: cobalamin-dependent protein, partial [Thermomonas sp.]|nr:cobalamin-dependent protein [Thermomonas sp.]